MICKHTFVIVKKNNNLNLLSWFNHCNKLLPGRISIFLKKMWACTKDDRVQRLEMGSIHFRAENNKVYVF